MKPDMTIGPWSISTRAAVDDFCESVFFVGNGCLGTRGFALWQTKKQPNAHAVFKAGLFSHISPHITDMVQLPDVMALIPEIEVPETVEQHLDLRSGVVTYGWESPDISFRMEKTASMADSQLLLVSLTMRAKAAAQLTLRSVADARVRNLPIHDDQMIASEYFVKLLELDSLGQDEMKMHTLAEGMPLRMGWQLISSRECLRESSIDGETAVTALTAALEAGESWEVEKYIRVLSGGETAHETSADPWESSRAAWEKLWENCDIEVEADDEALQGAVRYNIFQMLCNNAADRPDVSIGARGLTHGRYKGNTFWDTEIFMLPFFLWTRPETAKNLLLYRADRLGAAKDLAAKQNLDGARFPWMCSSDGTEQCESWDIGLCEVHITADIAYAMDRYVTVTQDEAFLEGHAKAVWLETARYWLSRLSWEPDRGLYSSFFVKGPDEYCGAAINNTYTNWMARHNITLALEHCVLDEAEEEKLRFARDHITILYDQSRGLYLQDELFERLEQAPFLKTDDAPSYKAVCFDRMQRYRVIKQADLVLLMCLFPDDFSEEEKRVVLLTYEPLTLHDSTLSWGIHALLCARLGLWEKASLYLDKAVYLDLEDLMGNTGHEGLHMAAMGSTWQALVFGAAGLWADEEGLSLSPMLPPGIRRLRFKVFYRGEQYALDIGQSGHTLRKEEA